MQIGDERVLKYRQGKYIKQALGKVISLNKVTPDGLRIVEVSFKDRVRKYSADHLW
jgi:hypothetical protein